MSAVAMQAVDGDERYRLMHAGGEVVYRVTVDDRWVGWVMDGRHWRGHGYGARRWLACWRQDGDRSARWCSELEFTSRRAALSALVEVVGR